MPISANAIPVANMRASGFIVETGEVSAPDIEAQISHSRKSSISWNRIVGRRFLQRREPPDQVTVSRTDLLQYFLNCGLDMSSWTNSV